MNGRYHPAVHDIERRWRDEITWLDPGTTGSSRWAFSADGTSSSQPLSHPAVTGRPAVGDFDGDGREDVLFVAPGSAADAVWYSTPSGIDARSVTVNGTYAITAGPMDLPPPTMPSTDDVLFVSNGADYLWRGQVDGTFRSTPVG